MVRPVVFRVIVGVFLTIGVRGGGWCQEKSLVPEFFGFYAVEGGRSVAIYEGQGADRAKTAVEVYSIPNNSAGSVMVFGFSRLTRFILFYSNAAEMAQTMTLHRMPRLRNIIEGPDLNQRSSGRQNPPAVSVVNKPLLARIAEL